MPRIRLHPEDFDVEELVLFPPTGEGGHTYLWVEKRRTTTDELARAVARAAGVPLRDVGYAGRKDRWAVTRQWLSVPRLDLDRARALELPGARVLDAVRHPEKLRLGQLRGNRFRLLVREVGADEARRAAQRLSELAEHGMPNRFGPQRFGRRGTNVEAGAAILRGAAPRRERRHAALLVSALQAAVFNQVLARRSAPIGRLLAGDVATVHATGGLFLVGDPEREQPRADRFEVSPTGPIFGTKMQPAGGVVAGLEAAVMADFGLPADPRRLTPPRGIRLFGDRRALRVRPDRATAERVAEGLELRFELPAGSYATVLLEELFPGGVEEGPASA